MISINPKLKTKLGFKGNTRLDLDYDEGMMALVDDGDDDYWSESGNRVILPGLESSSCCGVRDLNGIGEYSMSLPKLTPLEKGRLLRTCLTYAGKDSKFGLVYATTASGQEKTAGPVLRAAGFRRHRTFTNPNSGNVVNFYTLDVTKSGVRTKKRK